MGICVARIRGGLGEGVCVCVSVSVRGDGVWTCERVSMGVVCVSVQRCVNLGMPDVQVCVNVWVYLGVCVRV